jgi:membrane-associated phospholipid phosphatase
MPRSVRLARILSDLLSPPMVAIGAFWVLAGATARASRWPVFLACATTQSVFPLAFLGMAVRKGKIRDVNMSRREERRIGFLALGLVYAVGGVLAVLLGVRGPTLFVCLCTLAVIGAVWAVNLVYKASGHVAGATAYMAAVSVFVEPLHAGLFLIPAVSWARVRSGEHTRVQVILGALLGAGVSLGFFYLTERFIVPLR